MSKIIHCIIVDDEPIAREILESHLKKIDSIHIEASCKNALEAFQIINSKKVDLIFLDINMPDISGLSFAKSINRNIKVIFTTAYREYAVDGFDLQAVDYLLKPISFARLFQAVNKYFDENLASIQENATETEEEQSDFIFVRSDRKMIKVNFSDILYIESLSDYVKIHLDKKTVVTRETITSIEGKLPQKDFIRTHRAYIVSLSKLDSFTNEYVEIGQKMVPVSRTYKNAVMNRLENL
ncbi:LytR/AlgR family response regulator transcription factor [Prolixibacter denitrificans]|uniref:DNA-binding LytR/AlgR family response regulator n=1 Tax=Prolixibacter denitrificans TaxID=1541063 RepID=A0A2P8CAD2_9BACT|nr:LytTR family DNA-binding domain-containing protein [Prolixibacter denitrificans]PSK81928.1 DNA-binding LytR/AlgR family response regulator [Prolixibacter denitrificans]GET22525.1 DNA-binding response regulator [Prolixibacter denitrificans]